MTLRENMLHKTKYKGSYSQRAMSTNLLINFFPNLENEVNLIG